MDSIKVHNLDKHLNSNLIAKNNAYFKYEFVFMPIKMVGEIVWLYIAKEMDLERK